MKNEKKTNLTDVGEAVVNPATKITASESLKVEEVVPTIEENPSDAANSEETVQTVDDNLPAETNSDETSDGNDSEDNNSPQLPPNARKMKRLWWVKYLTTAIVLMIMTILVAWARGCFTETNPQQLLIYWCDAFFVPGILGTGFGLLVVASNGGTFDMLSYGFKSIFRLLKRDPIDRKYGSFYEYRKSRQENKRSFAYMLIVGGAFLFISLIILVIYYANEPAAAPAQ